MPDFASNAIIITDKATGAARVYDETTMKNEIAVEPFSGTTTKLHFTQINASASTLRLLMAGYMQMCLEWCLLSSTVAGPCID